MPATKVLRFGSYEHLLQVASEGNRVDGVQLMHSFGKPKLNELACDDKLFVKLVELSRLDLSVKEQAQEIARQIKYVLGYWNKAECLNLVEKTDDVTRLRNELQVLEDIGAIYMKDWLPEASADWSDYSDELLREVAPLLKDIVR